MIDLRFIEFYIRCLYDKSVEEYYHFKKADNQTKGWIHKLVQLNKNVMSISIH